MSDLEQLLRAELKARVAAAETERRNWARPDGDWPAVWSGGSGGSGRGATGRRLA
jgi:hypothetical protein